jgi:hypothetical protein
MKKTLIVFNVDNHIDLITNSSSELFVLEGETLETVKEMVSSVYPDYLNEYSDVICLKDASDEEIKTYMYYISDNNDSWNITRNMSLEDKRKYKIEELELTAQKYGMKPSKFYSNWKNRNKDKWFFGQVSSEGYKAVRNILDPNGKIFLLFSDGENPDYDMQENLSEIGIRYHLG